jgi:hypothetical protein
MSKEEYVQLEAVREALEKVIKSETEIDQVLALLSESTVQVDETKPAEPDSAEDTVESEEDGTPKPKFQNVILVSDPKGIINDDLVGWILQMPEDEDLQDITENLKKAAYNFNASKKGNKYPVTSIGLAIEAVPNKFLKPYNIKRKTKEPVFIVTTDNVLPRS